MTKPIDYMQMMDSLAQALYNAVKPKSPEQPVVIPEMVSAFKELAAWGVKRYEIINEKEEGGPIGQYQRGIEGRGDSIRKGSADAVNANTAYKGDANATGILAQLGIYKKRRGRTPRLPSYIEGDGGDSGGVSAVEPVVPVSGGDVLPGVDGDTQSDMAETVSGGVV